MQPAFVYLFWSAQPDSINFGQNPNKAKKSTVARLKGLLNFFLPPYAAGFEPASVAPDWDLRRTLYRLSYSAAAAEGLLCEPVLPRRVEASVVDGVVVALRQELDAAVLLLVQLQDSVHDRNVSAFDLQKNILSY